MGGEYAESKGSSMNDVNMMSYRPNYFSCLFVDNTISAWNVKNLALGGILSSKNRKQTKETISTTYNKQTSSSLYSIL